MKNIVQFYNLGIKAIENTSSSDNRVTFAGIKTTLGPIIHKLSTQKFQIPGEGEEKLSRYYKALSEEIQVGYRSLEETA